jgi:16S rRNA (cytosine1402-N4)-methyltransferase
MAALEHRPVLLAEVLTALQVQPAGIYLDGTFGRGGHAAEVLTRLGPEGRLLATDRDPEAVATAQQRFADDPRFSIVRGTFSMLGHEVAQRGWTGRVNGILLDLGVSSPQLDDPSRGFSFRTAGPLDMRMDPEQGESVADWLAHADERAIADVLFEYGEERYGRRIARAIVRAREGEEGPIRTTARLAQVIADASPRHERHKDPATRSFQALRIFINRELEELDAFLPQAVEMLAPGGRLAVISFHSLEDRRVKRFIRAEERGPESPPGLPIAPVFTRRLRAVGKAIFPSEQEVRDNARARSAVLRVAERV